MTRGEYIKKEDALSCFTWQNTKKDVWAAIKGLPAFSLPDSAENAEWILDYRDGGAAFYHCSKCNLGRAVIDGSDYKSLDEFRRCPICGTKMKGRGEQDENSKI